MDQKIGEVGKDGVSWDTYYLTDAQKRNAVIAENWQELHKPPKQSKIYLKVHQ